MERRHSYPRIFALLLSFLAIAALPISALAVDAIPDGAKGFAGVLHGKFVSTDDTGTTLVLKVDKVETVAKYKTFNKAKKPENLKGKTVMVYVRWFPGADKKTYAPSGDQVKFVKSLKEKDRVKIDVYSDGWNRLILTEAPK